MANIINSSFGKHHQLKLGWLNHLVYQEKKKSNYPRRYICHSKWWRSNIVNSVYRWIWDKTNFEVSVILVPFWTTQSSLNTNKKKKKIVDNTRQFQLPNNSYYRINNNDSKWHHPEASSIVWFSNIVYYKNALQGQNKWLHYNSFFNIFTISVNVKGYHILYSFP